MHEASAVYLWFHVTADKRDVLEGLIRAFYLRRLLASSGDVDKWKQLKTDFPLVPSMIDELLSSEWNIDELHLEDRHARFETQT